MRLLALLLLVSCAAGNQTTIKQPDGETKEQAWHRARVIEAAVNGCTTPCPADVRCIDDYGLCFTPCGWAQTSEAMRASLHIAALDADPTSSFLIDCPRPPRGMLEASR